jgi:hypothetical protein
MDRSFCFFFQKEALFFFEKKNQKTFTLLLAGPISVSFPRHRPRSTSPGILP